MVITRRSPIEVVLHCNLRSSIWSCTHPVMASSRGTTMAPSPKGGGKGELGSTSSLPSPKGTGTGQCLCSPTTHRGSFRCRHHRSASSAWNSMPTSPKPNNPVAQKSVDSM